MTPPVTPEGLLPCPFCGAEAYLGGGPMAQETYSVWCKGTGKRHHLDGGFDRDAMIAAWNTRAADPARILAALDLGGVNVVSRERTDAVLQGLQRQAAADAEIARMRALLDAAETALRKIGKTYPADGNRLIHSERQIADIVRAAQAKTQGEGD